MNLPEVLRRKLTYTTLPRPVHEFPKSKSVTQKLIQYHYQFNTNGKSLYIVYSNEHIKEVNVSV